VRWYCCYVDILIFTIPLCLFDYQQNCRTTLFGEAAFFHSVIVFVSSAITIYLKSKKYTRVGVNLSVISSLVAIV
jgi:hypothetical protein